MNFETALRDALAKSGKRNVIRQIDAEIGPVKQLILKRMERRVRTELGLGPNEKIDWSKIDWAALLKTLLPILLMILTML